MPRNLRTVLLVAAALGLVGLAVGLSHRGARGAARPATAAPAPPAQTDGKIQIALLLDTSGSMTGLIDQARTQLWRVVNELARARRDGKRPRLEIALYEYGKSSLSAEKGWIRQIVPFTDDLDRVSEELFALTTNGGDEYCGQVIRDATLGLEWSQAPGDLKLIFIAGNEPFTQGPVDFHTAIAAAREKGILVNTIHCGDAEVGAASGWRDGASLGGGEYLAIDQNAKTPYVAAPQDAELARLGVALNGTYVPYGSLGAASAARQQVQDQNASRWEGSLSARAVSKASGYYNNAGWDLVDAVREGNAHLEALRADDLPDNMRQMSAADRRAYVEAKAAERARIQSRIRELDEARRKFVAAELAKQGAAGTNTLDAAVLAVAHGAAESHGFRFE